jgi:hypothetical protein
MEDLSIIYYTCNYLDEKNPYFLGNTRKQLEKAIGDAPLIVVSHKPVQWPRMTENIVMGDIGRSHLNIYRQILAGAKAAKTKWVALAEDDVLYSEQHFNFQYFCKPEFMEKDYFLYDQNRISIFTWSKPPIFSMRFKRVVVNSLIAKRDMLVEAMEERFRRLEEIKDKWPERMILKFWGDPSRYEGNLGVTIRLAYEYHAWVPSIVFSHEYAYGYEFNQGKRKKDGDLRIVELADWGRAEDILKLWKP